MTETQHEAKRDPLVEHVVPLLAKAMSTSTATEDLWAYLRERVAAECSRMEEDAIREALAPLEDRFSLEALARVATAMADERASLDAA
jgi:hypothetical protein